MSLAETEKGHQLLSFTVSDMPIPPPDDHHIPIPFALVVAIHQGKTLLIYNQWRQVWELPGGMIDEGETPEDAAKRELQEETAQIAGELRFIGLAKMQLKPDDRIEFGAIYACELVDIRPFNENDEASQIGWWDLDMPFDGYITEIDSKLVEMTHMYLSTAKDLALWDEKAQDYAKANGTEDDRIWRQFRDMMWTSLGDLTGVDVLDIGCGHGWLAGQMKAKGANVQGIDGSSELLKIARENYPDIQFIQHDLSAGLPATDLQFDYVVANMVLMDIPDVSLLIRDIRNAISNHGRFIFTLTHPAFFFQKIDQEPETGTYFRRVTGYLEPQVWNVGHTHYHRSLSYYFDQLHINRFAVTRLCEPKHIPLLPQHPPERYSFYENIPIFIFIEARPFFDIAR